MEHNVNNRTLQDSFARLAEVDCWIFDLDNTIYPASCSLFEQIHDKMGEFIARELKVDRDEAYRIQKTLFREHGTTLRGLMTVYGLPPEGFLEHVHQIDLSRIPPDPVFTAALAALPGRKLVFTNGTHRHAENVLGHLGIGAHFDGIWDIAACGYMPKPDPAGYDAFVRRFGIVPGRAAMIEDMAKNLAPAAALGMTTVWLRGTLDWAREGSELDHIHHVVDELPPWLARVAALDRSFPSRRRD
jgi:putative hydrolase of the HAD superfamily